MQAIPDGSVDMILCDLPYGTTACKWDTVIPFEPLWAQYRRIAKRNAAIVLTASQPFTSALTLSAIDIFKYALVWEKSRAGGIFDVKFRPMKTHEDVLVFSAGGCATGSRAPMGYYPQGLYAIAPRPRKNLAVSSNVRTPVIGQGEQTLSGWPKSVIRIASEGGTVHPTQKPVALMEYLIRTYTREGETVLDNCMGSGTTGVACANTGRSFIGIERDDKYFQIASDRIAAAHEALAA